MSNIPKIRRKDEKIHDHPLPAPDPNFCSCCRKPILSKYHNVVRLDAAPEKIFNTKGQLLGIEGKKHPKAFYHATCFENWHYRLPGRIECSYCGILSMAKTLRDGTSIKEHCLCCCHTGKDYCSVVIS